MPFQKGNAGRRVGSVNKAPSIAQIFAQRKFDPIVAMIDIYEKASKKQDLALAGKMAAELAKYIHPQKKAVEISGDAEKPLQFLVTYARRTRDTPSA
jgi:hypothetical protein